MILVNNADTDNKNVFFNRNFRLVFFGALVSEFGAVFYSFAVSFYILDISENNAFLQGLYLAVCGVVLLLVTPLGGVLGDRFNKARIMFICDYVKGGLIIAATALMLLFRDNTAHMILLFIVGVFGNAVSGIFSPASGALLPHIVSELKLQQANAYYSVKSSLQSIVGVVLAGILYSSMPIYVLFFIVGVCYVLSGVSEMFIRYEEKRDSNQKLNVKLVFADIRDGVRYLKEQKVIMALMWTILFINFFLYPINGNLIPYFVKTDIAGAPSYLFDSFLTPEQWSSVFSMLIGVSALIGSVIMSAVKQKEKCGMATARRLCEVSAILITLTVFYMTLVVFGSSLNVFLVMFCAGCLMIGFLIACINIPINTTLMRIVEKDKLSKVTSIISIVSQGLVPVASVIAGIVLQYFGSYVMLIICSTGFTAASVYLLLNKYTKQI